MGLQIRDKYTSIRTYFTARFSTVHENNSYQFHLRKDQYFIIGMAIILFGVVGFYTNATSMISSFSVINIASLVLSISAIVVGRKSIKKGFDRD